MFEAIYYSAPIPRNSAALTVLGIAFDKLYFPGVYIPHDGYDAKQLMMEIERLQALDIPRRPNDMLTAMMRFVGTAKDLKGFCEFNGKKYEPFDALDSVPRDLAEDIYQVIHGPNPPNWRPMIPGCHTKGLPGGDEHILYPDIYRYFALSLTMAQATGIPLLNDSPSLPVPGNATSSSGHASALSSHLALECLTTALPNMPVLTVAELMEFRSSHATHLVGFRQAMVRFAADIHPQLQGLDPRDVDAKTAFYVQTEILPAIDELREIINSPARPWGRRASDAVQVAGTLAVAALLPTVATGIGAAARIAKFLGDEVDAYSAQRNAVRKNGMFCILKLEARNK